ncbi:MAG: hypothetical protein GY701_03290 [Sulfitobacter sp.]|nr:hypothetical protein [Sulfitobacter sp.]
MTDAQIGAMAADLHNRGTSDTAIQLLRKAARIDIRDGSYVTSIPPSLILHLSPALLDEISSAPVYAALVGAAKRLGLGSCVVQSVLADEEPGWRDRLVALEDWLDPPDGANWETIDGRLNDVKELFASGRTPDEYADVARRCRQLVIAAVNAVFDPVMTPAGEDLPQESNAKRRFELILASYESGSSVDKKVTAMMNKAWALASATVHKDDATRRHAFAIAQATIGIVRLLGLVADESSA